MATDGKTAEAGSVLSEMRVAERPWPVLRLLPTPVADRSRRRMTVLPPDRKMPDRRVRRAAQSA
ncbi:hypothetical protein [Azospirillum endophyticum]